VTDLFISVREEGNEAHAFPLLARGGEGGRDEHEAACLSSLLSGESA